MTVPNKTQRRRDAAEGPNAGISGPLTANPTISFSLISTSKPSTPRTTPFQETLNSIAAQDLQPSTQAANPRLTPTTSSSASASHPSTMAGSTATMAFPPIAAGVSSPVTFGSLESRITTPEPLVSASAASVFAATKPIPIPSTNAFSGDFGTITGTQIVPVANNGAFPWVGRQAYTPAPIVPTPGVNAIPWGGGRVHAPASMVSGPLVGVGPLRASLFEMAKLRLLQLAEMFPSDFTTLAGLYFQESGRGPYDVGMQKVFAMTLAWERDLRRVDRLEKEPSLPLNQWVVPYGDVRVREIAAAIRNDGVELALEAAICEWAIGVDVHDMIRLLSVAGWVNAGSMRQTPEWKVIDGILKMEEGEIKEKLMAEARVESPRFFQYCEQDVLNCGVNIYNKRVAPHEEPYSDYFETSLQYPVRSYRIFGSKDREEFPSAPPVTKRPRMMPGTGRPTQIHAVPFEERAPDGKGGKLPYALEYPAGHPDAPRVQKRFAEEKGSFGKSTRRKTASRTRSATPAKKEINPTLDGFVSALNYDTQRAIESQQQANASTRAHGDGNVGSHHLPSHNKEPTQIIVSGFTPSTQWAAIDTYEKISHGMICEDYARRPPAELRKYPNTLSSPSVYPRKLSDPERELARHYAGGESWVRLTCDSAEAADRAVEMSPQQIYGHMVYAELYTGTRPEIDEPIPVRDEDQQRGSFGSPRPPRKPSQTLGAAFSQHTINQQRPTSTLPRSFGIPAAMPANNQQPNDAASFSPSTASSATATGPDHPNLRNRHPSQAEENRAAYTTQELTNAPAAEPNLAMMKHFTDRPRTILRPATEAFLPQPTWIDRQVQWLRSWGIIPGDFIGNGPPLTENGDFDWARASWYWCAWNWMDTYLNTNFCNLKDE